MRYVSVITLILFVGLIVLRNVSLFRRGVRSFVFAETDKSDLLLVPVALLFFYTILACALHWPMPGVLGRPFWQNTVSGWIGQVFCIAALLFLGYTLLSFGSSFRVGIDTKAPGTLVTNGAFAVSRNPIYVSFLVFFFGMFLTYPNSILLIAIILFTLVIHRQVLREESFLKEHYGEEYQRYCRQVRRYL